MTFDRPQTLDAIHLGLDEAFRRLRVARTALVDCHSMISGDEPPRDLMAIERRIARALDEMGPS